MGQTTQGNPSQRESIHVTEVSPTQQSMPVEISPYQQARNAAIEGFIQDETATIDGLAKQLSSLNNQDPVEDPTTNSLVSAFYELDQYLVKGSASHNPQKLDQIKANAIKHIIDKVVKERKVSPLNVPGLVCTTTMPSFSIAPPNNENPGSELEPLVNVAQELGFFTINQNTKVVTVMGANGKKYSGVGVDLASLKSLGYKQKDQTDALKQRMGLELLPTKAADLRHLLNVGVMQLGDLGRPVLLEKVLGGASDVTLFDRDGSDPNAPSATQLMKVVDWLSGRNQGFSFEEYDDSIQIVSHDSFFYSITVKDKSSGVDLTFLVRKEGNQTNGSSKTKAQLLEEITRERTGSKITQVIAVRNKQAKSNSTW